MELNHVMWRYHPPRRRHIRAFMREHYTDEHLAALLAHMRDGKFSFYSCCCFIGIPTADHALRSETEYRGVPHYVEAKRLRGAALVEIALAEIGSNAVIHAEDDNDLICRFLLPIVRAEMRRRDRERAALPVKIEPVETVT